MWALLAFMSAALLGCYDFFKKVSLRDNSVLAVLFLNTFFSSLLFAPFILLSHAGVITSGHLYVPPTDAGTHLLLLLKAVIVLSSWLCGYIGIKHLPITLVSPIQSTRPVMVLLGALIICSPREATAVHNKCGKEFLTVTPGVRFADGDIGDQVRVMTPAQAKEIGSDYIVVGRPITAAADPVAAYERCVAEFVG